MTELAEELERTRPLPRRLIEALAQLNAAPPCLVDVLAVGAQSVLSKLHDGATLHFFRNERGVEILSRTLRFAYRRGERLKVVYARYDSDGNLTKIKFFSGHVSEETAQNVERFFEALAATLNEAFSE